MTDVIYGSLPTSNDIKGTLATEEKMSGNLATVFAKDGKSAYEVAVKNGFEGTETEWLATLKGEQGIQGIQGEKGNKGDKGDTGTQGIPGEKGDKGDKGDTGEQGIQGIQGKQGEKGDKGDAFTYSDFTSAQLASLKGEKGDKGDKGNTGEKGDTGNSGVYLGSGDMPDDCNVQIDPNGDVAEIVQTTGDSETAVMSQKAVTDAIGVNFDTYYSSNLLNEDKLTFDYCQMADGSKYSGSGYGLTDYIPVKEGDVIVFQASLNGVPNAKLYSFRYLCAFDANKIVLPEKGSTESITSYTVPEGVAFVRLSITKYNDFLSPMVHLGTDILPYEPYYIKQILKETAHNEEYIKGLINSENDVFEEYKSTNLLNPETAIIGKGMAADGKEYEGNNYLLTDFIPVSEGDILTFQGTTDGTVNRGKGKMRWVCAFDVNKNVLSGKGSNAFLNSYTVPEGVAYVRLSLSAITSYYEISVVKSEVVIPYEPYFDGKKLKAECLPKNSRRLALPSTIYGFANQPVALYFRNIMDYNPNNVNVSVASPVKGKTYHNRWEHIPTAELTTNVELRVYDNDYNIKNNERFNLLIKGASVKDNLSVLVIGDSTVNAGKETQKMLDLASADGYNLTLLGTRGSGANKHEGRGGWTAKMYVETASSTTYGTNPFYNPTSSIFDFAYYMAQQGYDGVDCVFLQLGINDIFGNYNETLRDRINSYISNMEIIVNSIHNYNENIKIVINLVIPSGTNQDAFADTYNNLAVWEQKKNTYEANIALLNKFDGMNNVYLSPYNAAIDSENNLPTDVHPNDAGYAQLGTQMYSYMRAIN